MHALRPLESDDCSLDPRQEEQRKPKCQRKPQDGMHPIGQRVFGLDRESKRHHQVANDQDHEISGRVIGTMMMQVLMTDRTRIRYLEKGAKQAAFATVW